MASPAPRRAPVSGGGGAITGSSGGGGAISGCDRRRRRDWLPRRGRAPQLLGLEPQRLEVGPKQRDLDGAVVGSHGGGVGQPRSSGGRQVQEGLRRRRDELWPSQRRRDHGGRGAGVVEALQRRLRRAQRVALGGEDVQGLARGGEVGLGAEVRRAASRPLGAARAAASAPRRADSSAAAASAPSARAAAARSSSHSRRRRGTSRFDARRRSTSSIRCAARAAMDASRASEASDDDDRRDGDADDGVDAAETGG